jgi:ABC transporter substrate binding protein
MCSDQLWNLISVLTITARQFFVERRRIVEVAAKYRLPTIYFQKEFVDEGGLMSYGADYDELFRNAASTWTRSWKVSNRLTCRCSKQTKFEFVINLKAAKQIGLTLSPEFLARANKVIKWGWVETEKNTGIEESRSLPFVPCSLRFAFRLKRAAAEEGPASWIFRWRCRFR